jgi:hypothetical protein
MTVTMSKKNFEKFIRGILTLDLEHNIHRFMLDDLNKMAARCGLYESWEQKRAIESAVTIGLLKLDGAFYCTALTVAQAEEMYKQFGGEFGEEKKVESKQTKL